MENSILPDPNIVFPIPNIKTVAYVKPTIKNKRIIVGDFTYLDFTYFGDIDFESHVTHFYDFYDDKLIIGKFCQIASGVEFIMNGANHKMDCVSTFPFYIFEKWNENAPSLDKLPHKGDTIIGNDVWIGENSTILPGINIGDGVIIGAKSVVSSNIEPYTIIAGNPAKIIRKRFDNELIELLLKLKWWNLPIEGIIELVPLLHNNNLEYVKEKIKEMIV
jgi:virginiamycin A acetyltransferase